MSIVRSNSKRLLKGAVAVDSASPPVPPVGSPPFNPAYAGTLPASLFAASGGSCGSPYVAPMGSEGRFAGNTPIPALGHAQLIAPWMSFMKSA
jgi:hypothetical protein